MDSAVLPGGFKSLKHKWLQTYQQDVQRQDTKPAPKPSTSSAKAADAKTASAAPTRSQQQQNTTAATTTKVDESELLHGFDATAAPVSNHAARRPAKRQPENPGQAPPNKRPCPPEHTLKKQRGDSTKNTKQSRNTLAKHAAKASQAAADSGAAATKQPHPRSKHQGKAPPTSDSGTHAKPPDGGGGNSSTAAASHRGPDMQDSLSERKHPAATAAVGRDEAAVKGEPGVATSSQHHAWQDGRRTSRTVPVQRALSTGASSALGLLNVADYSSYEQLYAALTRLMAGSAKQDPTTASVAPKLVYRDAVGDWLLLSPDEPWSLFQSTVQAVMIM